MLIRHRIVPGLITLIAVLLAACGGTGSGGNPGNGSSSAPTTPAPSALQYSTPPAFSVGTAIASLTPSITGTVTSYSISPVLPAGLSINTTTGVISGTPTAAAASMAYIVTAANSTGSTMATITIVVNGAAATFNYGSTYYAYSVNVPAQTLSPDITSGTVTAWSVNPTLPAGLFLDMTSGDISGTPTTVSAATSYTLTATSSGGQSTYATSIVVGSAPLLDLGHTSTVNAVLYSGAYVLSSDTAGHWLLQNFASGTMIASGDNACAPLVCAFPDANPAPAPIGLGGSVMIDDIAGAVEVRPTSTGALLSTLTGAFSWTQLAVDGSYVATGSTTALTVWSTAGAKLFAIPGDYSKAVTFSGAGQILIALGAAGQNVIQTVTVPGGTVSVSATFQGNFAAWFQDGGRFLTSLGTTVWTYSSAASQQDLTTVASATGLAGTGNWFWTFDASGDLSIYKVGASMAPALTSTFGTDALAIPSGATLGILAPGVGPISVFDLSGATPASSTYTAATGHQTAYAATSSAAFAVANNHGVVLDGASIASQPRYLTLGEAWSLVGGSSYFSIATASGSILYYNTGSNTLAGTIPFSSSQLSSSSTGTTLAALANTLDPDAATDRTINVYSLPSATVTQTFPATVNTRPLVTGIAMNGAGSVLSENFTLSAGGCDAQVIQISNGASIWCDTTGNLTNIKLSPDGTLIAAGPILDGGATTNLYLNATLVTTVPGWAVGWLDNGRLLANIYTVSHPSLSVYGGAVIYDPTGKVLGNLPTLPQFLGISPATSTTVYGPPYVPPLNAVANLAPTGNGPNEVESLITSAITWSSGNAATPPQTGSTTGAVAGSEIVFASGHWVLAQPYGP